MSDEMRMDEQLERSPFCERKGERSGYRTRRIIETVTPDPSNPTVFMYLDRGPIRWTPDKRKVAERRHAERRKLK